MSEMTQLMCNMFLTFYICFSECSEFEKLLNAFVLVLYCAFLFHVCIVIIKLVCIAV